MFSPWCFRHGRQWVAHWSWALGLGAQAAGAADQSVDPPGFQVWVPSPFIGVHTHLEALVLCAQAACLLISVHANQTSGVC